MLRAAAIMEIIANALDPFSGSDDCDRDSEGTCLCVVVVRRSRVFQHGAAHTRHGLLPPTSFKTRPSNEAGIMSIPRLLHRWSILIRCAWYHIRRRRTMSDLLQDIPIEFNRKYIAEDRVQFYERIVKVVEKVKIGPSACWKDNDGVGHEKIISEVCTDKDENALLWAVIQRCVVHTHHANSCTSLPTSSQQSLAAAESSSNGASIFSESSISAEVTRRTARDTIVFFQTEAQANNYARTDKATLQKTFTPVRDGDGFRHSFLKFLIICSSVSKASPYYNLLTSNCYSYVAIVIAMLEDILGGTCKEEENFILGKYKGHQIVDKEAVATAVTAAKAPYAERYEGAMKIVSIRFPLCRNHAYYTFVAPRESR